MNALRGTSLSGVLVALFAFILPFVTSRHLFFGAINAKYFFIVGFASLLALVLCYQVATKKKVLTFSGRWLLVALGMFVVSLVASALAGVYPERSFFSDIQRTSGVIFLVYVGLLAWCAAELLKERDWVLVRQAVIASSALLSLFTILGIQGFGFSGRIFTINLDIVGATLANETFAGAYLLLGFVITLIELLKSKTFQTRYVLLGAALLQFFSPLLFNAKALLSGAAFSNPLLLVGNARASSLAAVIGVVWFGGLWLLKRFAPAHRTRHLLLGWCALWVVGILSLIGLLFTPGSVVQERYIEESTAARILVWEGSVEAFKEKPLLGWGPENFRFAFEKHFDNRLYLDQNIGEIWFDRAHNLILDTLVATGVVGALALVLLWGYFLLVVVRAARAGLIQTIEAYGWGVLVVLHFLQLQTSFDTVATYGLMGLVLGYGLYLESQLHASSKPPSPSLQRVVAGGAGWLIVGLLFFTLVGEYVRQDSLFGIFETRDPARQTMLIEKALSRQSSFETLRFSSASFRKGLLEALAEKDKAARPALLATGMPQLKLYEQYLRDYVAANPEDYRARMNLVYHLLIESSLGDNQIAEARRIIDASYSLSPENPLTYVLDGVASLYGGDRARAREKIEAAVAVNPEAPFALEMLDYLAKQEAKFPNISVLRLENL